jgi:hypothetical protein
MPRPHTHRDPAASTRERDQGGDQHASGSNRGRAVSYAAAAARAAAPPPWICERERARDRVSARRAVRAGWRGGRGRLVWAYLLRFGWKPGQRSRGTVHRLLARALTMLFMKRARLAVHRADALALLLRRELLGVLAERPMPPCTGCAPDNSQAICERGTRWLAAVNRRSAQSARGKTCIGACVCGFSAGSP